ncbi:serologically defined colon cancer antigen 8 homolog isoform X1 [Hippoglossus stenolepis]|uniref:serologically defined colon cancer antigen 8 homolog isoform X1 n=1 Tax=Hippoglossus stenolepis TaxID=195615 RepID=UPI001FAFDB46|nr:serologically defined colon cancer antigen 8 homolog isoform X1 [Hippoglossus stenolepis]
MLHNQSDYIRLLEAEVRLCKVVQQRELLLRSLARRGLQLEGEVNILKQSLAQAKEEGTQKEELAQTRVAELEEQLGRAQRDKSSLTNQLQTARRHIIDQDKDNATRVAELEGQLGRAQRDNSSLTNQLENACPHIIDQDKDNATRVAELEEQLGRAQRDKSSLTNQLQTARRHIIDQDKDNATMSVDLQYRYNQAKWKEQVERELSNLKIRNTRQLENSAKEVEGLSSELAGCRIHLGVVQKEGSQWQDKALSLTEQLADAQRQLNLTRHEVKSAERSHKEIMESTTLSAQERHRDMTALLEAQYKQRVGEQDGLLSSQSSMIKKMGGECNRLVAQLEEMAEKHRRKEKQTAVEKKDLEETITSLEARCCNLEEQSGL